MKEHTALTPKTIFQDLVKTVKYHKKREDGGNYSNEEIAKDLGYELPHFNNLVGTNGKVTEKHIKKIKEKYPDILKEEIITNSKIETGSLSELLASNRILADANKTLADAHKDITRANLELVQMFKELNSAPRYSRKPPPERLLVF